MERGVPNPPPGSRTAESAFDAVFGARAAESAPGGTGKPHIGNRKTENGKRIAESG